jgi:hypothetical protein
MINQLNVSPHNGIDGEGNLRVPQQLISGFGLGSGHQSGTVKIPRHLLGFGLSWPWSFIQAAEQLCRASRPDAAHHRNTA